MRKALLFISSLFLVLFVHSCVPQKYQLPSLKFFPPIKIEQLKGVTVKGIELGKYLFYDSILSLNYDKSCASCHKQEFAFSDSTLRISNKNTIRNTLPLFNLLWNNSFFWDGRAKSLQEQVFHPITNKNELSLTVNLLLERLNNSSFYKHQFYKIFKTPKIDSNQIATVLSQFLKTIFSTHSRYDSALVGLAILSEDEIRGQELMNDMTKGDCVHCHTTDTDVLGTTQNFSNNGLQLPITDSGLWYVTNNKNDIGKFKIPSLRNLKFTAPYMHDGRFKTLEEVMKFYSENVHYSEFTDAKMTKARQRGVRLSPSEQKQIILFLNTINDYDLITNKKYSNPFTN